MTAFRQQFCDSRRMTRYSGFRTRQEPPISTPLPRDAQLRRRGFVVFIASTRGVHVHRPGQTCVFFLYYVFNF